MAGVMQIDLPWPPSMNSYWRHLSKGPLAGRVLISEEGRKYRTAVQQVVIAQGCHGPRGVGQQRIKVDLEVRMPDKRRRDLDNLPKALLDALTHATVWHDDSQIDDLRVWRSDRIGGFVRVTIEPMLVQQLGLIPHDVIEACELPF